MKKSLVIIASLIVIITIVVVASIFLDVWRIPFMQVEVFGISHSAVHWLGWIGTIYIAFATPIYPIVKQKFPLRLNRMLSVHVVGNLLGVLLVSVHFAHQATRPAYSYPDLGTGVILYATMILLSATGLVLVSGIGKKLSRQIRFLHPAFAITFYIVIVMHILRDLFIISPFT